MYIQCTQDARSVRSHPAPRPRATTLTVANTVPATVISYEVTLDGRTQPMSTVHTVQVLHTAECDYTSLGTELATSEAMGFVDGLGRVRATLAQGERDTGAHHWIRSGLARKISRSRPLGTMPPRRRSATRSTMGRAFTPTRARRAAPTASGA
jgi:hypothetical protein